MASRLFLALALFCLTLHTSDAKVDQKLIARACDHTKAGQVCVNWLSDNENDSDLSGIDKSSLNSIAFFALKKIEKEAATVSEAVEIKLLSKGSDALPPATQQGLSDCRDHYVPAVDLIEEAVDAVANKGYADAIKFLKASTLDLTACQKSLAKLQPDPSAGKPTKADEHALMAINHRDVLASHVAMAQSILELAGGGAAVAAATPAPAPSS